MRICHLRASNFYGGPERQLHWHARMAKGTEYEIILASYSEQGERPEFLEIASTEGIETCLFRVKSAYDFGALRQILQYIIESGIELICTHDYRSHILSYWATRKLRKQGKVRWIAFSRGWTSDTLRVQVYTMLEKFFVRFADHIVAVSGAQRERLRRLLIPPDKISVVFNSIDVGNLKRIEGENLRSRYDFPPDSIILLSAGRFSSEKGQAILIEAMKIALASEARLRLILYGDGPELASVRMKVKNFKLEDKILLPGFEKNLLSHLKGADLLVNPSLSEGLPNIVLEAMALGVPVVATAVGGVPEIITDGIEGRLVPPGDAVRLAEAIIGMARSPQDAAMMADSARQRIQEEFSFESQMIALRAVYQRFGSRTISAGS
ncbi:MAG: glycosyltransferase [bacterium]